MSKNAGDSVAGASKGRAMARGVVTRRNLFKLGAFGLAAAAIKPQWGCRPAPPACQTASCALEKYVTPLAIPPVMQPSGVLDGAIYYEVPMTQFLQKLHRDLPATTLWGYNGIYPGPTFETRTGEPLKVRWINNLPPQHLFAVDPTIHCGHNAMGCQPAVRTVVHVHGGVQPPDSDGYPEAWITPGQDVLYTYPNQQAPTTLWYHDHALGITRLNVYAGLAGFYLVRDAAEEALGLPAGEFEIPLLIQDRSLNLDGSLFYPSVGDDPDMHPNWVPEFFGDVAVVNGVIWPFANVQPRKYRLRLLNGSNARFLTLQLDQGLYFYQIGGDGGLLAEPLLLHEITLAPAERADVVVDFSSAAGMAVTMTNSAPAPFPGGGEVALPEIMRFNVSDAAVADPSVVPQNLRAIIRIPESEATVVSDIELQEALAGDMSLGLLLNARRWDDPLTPEEQPRLGSTTIWRLINTTGDNHPIHIHLIEFQILDRTPFDVDRYLSDRTLVFTGPAFPPDLNELGWKDTVKAPPGFVTRLIMRWEGFSGRYVYHCHILEHEDNEMMRPLEILPAEA